MNTVKAFLALLKHHMNSYGVNSKLLFEITISTREFSREISIHNFAKFDKKKPSTYQKVKKPSGPLISFGGIGYSCMKADIESKNESASNENKG